MRVLVCGSRDFDNANLLITVLQGIFEMEQIGWLCVHASHLTIIQGGATGADALAKQWAMTPGPHPAVQATSSDEMMVFCEEYPADWGRYGTRAGYLRNQQMLDEGKPDLVVAFYKGTERSKGTAMMVDIARTAGVQCWEIFS